MFNTTILTKKISTTACILAFIWGVSGSVSAQNWDQIFKAVADDASRTGISSSTRAADERAGFSVAISGNYAVIGVPGDKQDAFGINDITGAGSALVFKFDGTNWKRVKKLTPTGTNSRRENDFFGSAVAISGDYIAVGAPEQDFDANGGNELFAAGAVFVFKKDQGGTDNWGQIAKITPSGINARNTGDQFGSSVAIGGDYLLVGAPGNSYDASGGGFSSQAGAVFVFKKNQGGTDNWGQIAKVVSTDRQAGDKFGSAIAVSGSVAIVGAPFQDTDAGNANPIPDAGACYLFNQNQGGTDAWGQTHKLVPSVRGNGNGFGFSVTIDGLYAAAGAPYQDEDAAGANPLSNAGAAYVFFQDQGSPGAWGQQAAITASGAGGRNSGDEFGTSVSISGQYLAVGAPNNPFNAAGTSPLTKAGSAFVFKRDQGGVNAWGQLRKVVATNRSAGDLLGFSVALQGNSLLAGAYGYSLNEISMQSLANAGGAAFFSKDQGGADNWGLLQMLIGGDIAPNDNMGLAVAVSGNYAVVGAPYEDEDNVGNTITHAGAAYVFKKNLSSWSLLKKITLSERKANDLFGFSVTISGDWIAIGAPQYDPDAGLTDAGAVFIFNRTQGGADNWGLVKTILPTGNNAHQAGDNFGFSVSLSGDWLLVGSPYQDYDVNGGNQVADFGAAYVFRRDQGGNNNWGQVKKIIPSAGGNRNSGDNFGFSVAISGDYAIVGAPNVDSDASGSLPVSDAGAAFVFKRNQSGADAWGQLRKLVAFADSNARNPNDRFGYSVAIDGGYALVGAPFHGFDATGRNELSNAGAAYVFRSNQGGTDVWGALKKITATGTNARTADDQFGFSVALSAGYAVIGAPQHNFDGNGTNAAGDAGAAFVFAASQGGIENWGLVRKLTATGSNNREANDKFGSAVAINFGTVWIGAPFHSLDAAGSKRIAGAGACFVYQGPLVSIWDGTTWQGGTPNSSQDAIIDGDFNTQTHGNITCRNLTINFGKVLRIHAAGAVVAATAFNNGSILNCSGGTFTSGAFSGTPVVLPAPEPTTAPSGINLVALAGNRLEIRWTPGNGSSRLVVLKANSAPAPAAAVDGETYNADANFAGAGSALDGGKVVYKGSGNSVIVSGLSAETYFAAVYEYNENAGCGPNYRAGVASSPVLGLNDNSALIRLYPNPSQGDCIIESPEPAQVTLMTLAGAVLQNFTAHGQTRFQIPTKGIYLVQLKTATAQTVKKLIVE